MKGLKLTFSFELSVFDGYRVFHTGAGLRREIVGIHIHILTRILDSNDAFQFYKNSSIKGHYRLQHFVLITNCYTFIFVGTEEDNEDRSHGNVGMYTAAHVLDQEQWEA